MALVKMPSVEEEYKRNKDLKKSDVEALKEWLSKQPHLPKISDFEIILFLHSNYYRLEPTKTTIDMFFTVKTHIPEFFSDRDPIGSEGLKFHCSVATVIVLPGTTKEGYKVLFGRLLDPEPSHYVFNDAVKYFSMVFELSLRTEPTCPGYIIIFDMALSSFGHLSRVTPAGMKKGACYLQEALPVRLKAIHVINTISIVDLLLSMVKPFLKKDLLDMITLHTTLKSLEKHISIDVLPNDQGGKAGPLKDLHGKQVEKVKQHRDWFLEDEARSKVNESVRPGKSKNPTELFGIEGSFKKLDID